MTTITVLKNKIKTLLVQFSNSDNLSLIIRITKPAKKKVFYEYYATFYSEVKLKPVLPLVKPGLIFFVLYFSPEPETTPTDR